MFRTRFVSALASLICLMGLSCGAAAAEVDSGGVYCFSSDDFSGGTPITGICITSVPDQALGSLNLGSRVLVPGDVLTADQAAHMTFCSLGSETDAAAEVGYLPVYPEGVASSAAVTIGIRGKENKAPAAEDSALETYKNLPASGKLKVTDPEEESMTYELLRQPRRGSVTISPDGSFTYTPKKNKVGVDSFTYTATDASGKTSREATVTITILKPTDAAQYTDTVGMNCRFAAEWLKNTGIFAGEAVAGNACFCPEQAVTRGEFVTMLVKALDIPVEEAITAGGDDDDIPQWLRPYYAAALRAGLTTGLPQQSFGANEPIPAAEAGTMLENALNLTAGWTEDKEISVWAEDTTAADPLTRADAAVALYQAAQRAKQNAPEGRL